MTAYGKNNCAVNVMMWCWGLITWCDNFPLISYYMTRGKLCTVMMFLGVTCPPLPVKDNGIDIHGKVILKLVSKEVVQKQQK